MQGSLATIFHKEERYSLELAETVVHEFKLELICEDELTDEIVETIRAAAQTGQTTAGWICVVDLERVVPIRTGRDIRRAPQKLGESAGGFSYRNGCRAKSLANAVQTPRSEAD